METVGQIWESVQVYIPSLLGALAILIVGWIVAKIIAMVIRSGLRKTTIDDRLVQWIAGEERGKRIAVEDVVSKVVFYAIMLFVLVAFFQTLGLTQLTEPLNALLNQVFVFAPRVLGAIVLLIVAWLVGSALRMVVTRLLSSTKIDERVSAEIAEEGKTPVPLSKTLGDSVYWLAFLLFLPAILGTLSLDGLLQPVQLMLNKVLEYVPNLASAAAILVIGWFVARIVQRVVEGLLGAVGVDQLSEKLGLGRALGQQSLSKLLALIVYVLILVPVLVSSLNALGLDAVTRPASNMLDTMLGAIPGLFAATLVLAVAFLIGKVLSGLLTNVLSGVGFDKLLAKLGLRIDTDVDGRSPSAIVGYIVLVAVMFFGLVEASSLLGFQTMADLFTELLVFGSHILIGLVVFGVGLYLANFAGSTIEASRTSQARVLSIGARAAILVLTGAMALRELGVANEIITLAFGLTLGAIAVAVAVAFGIGGRDLAAQQLQQWQKAVQGENE